MIQTGSTGGGNTMFCSYEVVAQDFASHSYLCTCHRVKFSGSIWPRKELKPIFTRHTRPVIHWRRDHSLSSESARQKKKEGPVCSSVQKDVLVTQDLSTVPHVLSSFWEVAEQRAGQGHAVLCLLEMFVDVLLHVSVQHEGM